MSVLASDDTEELIRHKGIHGGLLELLRPFGESVQGKVTIRDSTGLSRSWDDFGIRFTGVKDGLESPRLADRRSVDSMSSQQLPGKRGSLAEFKPARLRSGGDVQQIEELVDRHLTFAEEQSWPVDTDYLTSKTSSSGDPTSTSPYYKLYLRRLLSGLPLIPSETLSHPVASVIAISSRSASPIEDLRNLFTSSNSGADRLPLWVNNEYLRYYVLVHDEDYDDLSASLTLFDQMKRHFGLHCHLLRLRSTQCVSSDDSATPLPRCEWSSAAEELAEIVRRESSDDDIDPTPSIFATDAIALRAFVREMVTQSIVPSMERSSAQWNDAVASRRRGLSGRFMSLSKRLTTFGSRAASVPNVVASSYDAVAGIYKPEAPEAVMRKLADYAMMLRDYRLAQGVYEVLTGDFKNDKAWRYYAGANEMCAVSTLLMTSGGGRTRSETVEGYLETAYYSYVTRTGQTYHALRTLILGIELMTSKPDAARWCTRILQDKLVGPVGCVLVMERIAGCYPGSSSKQRRRKAAFWGTLSAEAWLQGEKTRQAEKSLSLAMRLYVEDDQVESEKALMRVLPTEMNVFLRGLRKAIEANRSGVHHLDEAELRRRKGQEAEDEARGIETTQSAFADPLGAVPSVPEADAALTVVTVPMQEEGSRSPPTPTRALAMRSPVLMERKDPGDDGFE